MTRDEAIEAGARVIAQHAAWATTGPDEVTGRWDVICYDCGLRLGDRAEIAAGAARTDDRPFYAALARHQVEIALDAAGWVEPAGYVIAVDDRDQPGTVYGSAWPDLEGARGYAIRGERIWGLVPVEGAIEPGTNEGDA